MLDLACQIFRLYWGLSLGSTKELLKLASINNYAIDLTENKQILSGPVYKLGGARNSEDVYQDLANKFIRPPKSQVENPILFLFRKKMETFGYVSTLVTPITWLSESQCSLP